MAGGRITEGKGNIGPIEAYDILLRRNIDENRLLTERTTIYLAASSVLFLAFVMLNQPSVVLAPVLAKWFRVILAFLGVILTFLFYSFARYTHNTLEFLWGAQEKIERTHEFKYMREKGICPQIDGLQKFAYGQKQWDKGNIVQGRWWRKPVFARHMTCICLPATFGALWITSLVIATLAFFD
jgi:hypothetical protein